MTLRLSILDQSPIPAGGAPAEALIATLQLARSAECLGYHRFWVAEHHGAAGFAGTAPEIMVASLLENTRRLRIGSGGVLLPRYEPRKVAEVFRVLGALHPGRVDLGIGRAGGIARDFPRRFAEVIDLLGKPYPGYIPPTVWLLGAGSGSARLAGALGTRYAFAHFLSPQLSTAALDTFHGSGTVHASTRSALAVRVVVADTEAKAQELTAGFLLWRSRKDLGHNEPFPSPATVRSHSWTAEEDARVGHSGRQLVAGTPHQVKAALIGLARAHQVDEIIVNTLTHDPVDRLRSYELLAETFQLAPKA
ncbi:MULTISPECIES: MsnO8 family LLM class oxidoreductase [Streptomyces]|jgi:alkanesulfonate monooxygenase SsuD/methylene tetrahydromethanopterin reductase-like flavin-dependent oxidoreductase (luciferase family)|uniref:MsnO8 family LLM class oxidoreductase n=1 Tax=Streptomyces TaxID=1883 RepID=UPI000BCA2112|nr:MsnO8 family LLM class oxidoreductase [Streptomyces sp. OK228]SOE19728.1 luciferase family oxidoreductase, group 1 [Streptomyces sp. OK228]